MRITKRHWFRKATEAIAKELRNDQLYQCLQKGVPVSTKAQSLGLATEQPSRTMKSAGLEEQENQDVK